MSRSSVGIGWLAAAAIALLRIGIGIHFFSEGWAKLENPKPFSAGFFSTAKGPLAPYYKNLVWDPDGLYRLDMKETLAEWESYRGRVGGHYGFDDKQHKQADDSLKRFSDRLKAFFGSKSETIDEYLLWLERRDKNASDVTRQLKSLQAHDARIASETKKLWAELVPPLDKLWKDFETDLNNIATDSQYRRAGRLAIGKPGRALVDSESLDRLVPWFDMAIGMCLILGLFTRVAALLAAGFLISICLTQWPLAPGAAPIYNQAVEALALLVLAAVGAGRYLGLDYLCGGLRAICCPPKSAKQEHQA